jgi:hypothetical protein
VVDAGRFPVEDASELAVDHEELVLVEIAVDQDASMASACLEQLRPAPDLPAAAETVGGLRDRVPGGLRVEGAAQPLHVRGVKMRRRTGTG